ncbi:hypothetical protein LEN26_019401 [Aphanomyces euteiches]|nr:hypothetical protein LEN26_019401 [Aphanomyces euteiches]KAH9128473.1 hypothetical protein AeMF1_001357 [Aphanomyces euteiches]KAH9195629.1 hypothetical protein AeNC1_002413 [Aphanomyces euteiches]
MFKTRPKKEKRVRKRSPVEDGVDDATSDVSLEELREIKEDQKYRERKRLQSEKPRTNAAKEASTMSSLTAQFTTQSSTIGNDPIEDIKNKYVEGRLKELYASNVTTEPQKKQEDELDLYRIPDHLKEPMNITDTPVDRGIVSFNTGIAEVELPPSDPAATLLATKEAFANAHKESQAGQISSTDLPANMSANFIQHHADHMLRKKALQAKTLSTTSLP